MKQLKGQTINMRQMCETIEKAKILKFEEDGRHPTAREIFEYSPTGELMMIWEWYAAAKNKLKQDNQ